MLKSLKARILLLLCLVISPCYVFIYLSFDYSRENAIQKLKSVSHQFANYAATEQANIVDDTKHTLSQVVKFPLLQNVDSTECREFALLLRNFLSRRFESIGFPNAQGVVTCSGSNLMGPVDLSHRQYIADAISKKQFTSSGVQMDQIEGVPTLNFAYPVLSDKDGATVLRLAVAVTTLKWWAHKLSEQDLPANSVAFILDANDKVVASYPDTVNYEQPEGFEDIYFSSDRIGRVYSKEQVFGTDGKIMMTFVIGISVDEALAAINKSYALLLFSLSVVCLFFIMLVTWLFKRSISRPFLILTDLVKRLGRNESVAHQAPISVTEFNNLQTCFLDMAQRKMEAEKEIITQTLTDRLTGLGSREAFIYNAEKRLMNASTQKLAVILLDCDRFKEINNTRGHQIGDFLLKAMAWRLAEFCGPEKHLARLGGDEFIFILAGNDADEERTWRYAQQLRELIEQPLKSPLGDVRLTASIGIAHYPSDGLDIGALMAAADQAMYFAKDSGRNTVKRYHESLKNRLEERIQLTNDLRSGLDHDEFYLVYQPIVDHLGKAVKFEALIRWQHPTLGLVPPDKFIEFAEESGQIVDIGDWVLREAKQGYEALRNAIGNELQVSVNISPIQLSALKGKLNAFLEALATDHTNTQNKNGIVVEITEHLLMNLDESTRKALTSFREKGIQVALDDFGTGYSSLAYILTYDIDYLKIDKSFVQNLGENASSLSLCKAIITMAHTLGIKVVAEGVETKLQADLLLNIKCDYLQGYYFSRPARLEDVLHSYSHKTGAG